MKTFVTSTGRTITAADAGRAAELARQYGLGEIVGLAEQQATAAARERRQRSAQSFVLWDDLLQNIAAEGDLIEVATALLDEGRPSQYVVLARGSRGPRALNAAERRRLQELIHELTE